LDSQGGFPDLAELFTLAFASAEFNVNLTEDSCWTDCDLFSFQLEAAKQSENTGLNAMI
jgi:hypothetical protein